MIDINIFSLLKLIQLKSAQRYFCKSTLKFGHNKENKGREPGPKKIKYFIITYAVMLQTPPKSKLRLAI